MSVAQVLLNVLNDENEDLTKKIKLAENAFLSSEIVSDQCIERFLEVFIEKLNHQDTSEANAKNLVLECLSPLLENRAFNQFFAFNVQTYCKFIPSVITHLKDKGTIIEFIRNDNVFPNIITHREKFQKYFLDCSLKVLISTLKSFDDDELLFKEVSCLLQRCFYFKQLKSFEGFFNKIFGKEETEEKHIVPKTIFKYLVTSYKSDGNADVTFKLLFHSFCNAYSKKTHLIYKCFILILEMIGFDCSKTFTLNKISKYQISETSLKKSVKILSEIVNVLVSHSDISTCKIDDVTFADFLALISKTVMSLTSNPDEYCYEIITDLAEINPMIIDSIINEVLPYIMWSDNRNYKKQYDMLMMSIFGVYSKLHRVQNLVSKLLTSLKNDSNEEAPLSFNGSVDYDSRKSYQLNCELISNEVLMYFSQCITNLASWQIINLLKTLTFHLKTAIKDLSSVNDESGILKCIGLISPLLCCLLSSVRIAEHTVPDNVVEKFVKGLEELKELLADYGKTLFNREHNQILLLSFLNVCYTLGEVEMMLAYYSDGKVNLKRTIDNDTSACNLTYLHSYLTVSEWCLISERITNFGEKPCKLIMQKLFIQKLRAMFIFEHKLKEDFIIPVTKALTSNLDENWELIISNTFVLKHLLPHFTGSVIYSLAELSLADISDKNTLNILSHVHLLEVNDLIRNALIYSTISMVNQQMKVKRKLDEDFVWKPISSKLFRLISDNFIYENDLPEMFEKIKSLFHKEIEKEMTLNVSATFQLNTMGILKYLNILEQLPIIFCSSMLQSIIMSYLFLLHRDSCTLNDLVLKEKLETLIIGMCDENKINLIDTFAPATFIGYLVEYFSRSSDIFTIYLNSVVKSENCILQFESGVQFLIGNVVAPKNLSLNMLCLNAFNKWKKNKLSLLMKNKIGEYQSLIQKQLLLSLSLQNVDSNLVEVYAVLLKMALSKNEPETISKLRPMLASYIEYGISEQENRHVKGLVLLLTTVLRHKSDLELSDDFCLKAWKSCKIEEISDETVDEYCPLISLIFQHVSNDDYQQMAHVLFTVTKSSMDNKNLEQLCRYIKIWMAILSTDFNVTRMKVWQELLGSIMNQLYNLLETCDYDGNVYRIIVNFIESIIQTVHLPLTSALCDIFLIFPPFILHRDEANFVECYNLSISLLTALLKYRKVLMLDRLPPFLQGYRLLLRKLCENANSDSNKSIDDIHRISDCAHSLEKLTNSLVTCKKDMSRISCFLIAEILNRFEEITLYPNVKKHLNNCVYSLMSLCDEHSVSYLMRVLSSAATEMFKIMFSHYKKYYKFTGKV